MLFLHIAAGAILGYLLWIILKLALKTLLWFVLLIVLTAVLLPSLLLAFGGLALGVVSLLATLGLLLMTSALSK